MVRIPGAVAARAAAASGQGLVRSATALVAEARETVSAYRRLAVRADALLVELEEPLRALTPGLRRLATVLDDPVVEDLPDTLRTVQRDLLPVLRALADTSERVAFVAGLPGAGLLGRRRPAASTSTTTVQQVVDP